MLQAILFDLDGTLAHTDEIHFQTWRELLLAYDIEIDIAFYKANFSGRLNPDIVKDLLPQLSPAAGQALSDRKEAEFRDRAQHLPPLPGLPALRDWAAQQQIREVVVTNAPRANAEFMIEALGMTDTFEFVVLAEELPRAKPDPLPYQHALDRLGIAPTAAITFEDSPAGVRSSVAADIPTVGVATTQSPADLYALGAQLVIADFTDPALQSFLAAAQANPRSRSLA